jgi:hypothetical protein
MGFLRLHLEICARYATGHVLAEFRPTHRYSQMDSNVHSLNDATTGSYAVRTESGTLYAIHLDSPREVVRLQNDRQPVPRYDHLPTAELRRDGEAIRLLKIVEMQVGRRGLMWLDVRLDGIPTLRGTTELLSITRLQRPLRS